MGVPMKKFLARLVLVLLLLLRPIGEPSALECIAFAVVGMILARAVGVESVPGGIAFALGVVYVLGLLRLALDAAVGRKGA